MSGPRGRFSAAINLAQSIADAGGVPVNYMQVTGLTYSGEMIDGVKLKGTLNGGERDVRARVVINATGIFSDDILRMNQPAAAPIITHSQGVHLVLDKRFLKGTTAISRDHHLKRQQMDHLPQDG